MAELKYLDISPEDLAKVNKNRAAREAVGIDPEQLFIAEFGKHFGWLGVQAILNNEIESDTAVWLLQGARKVDQMRTYNQAQAVFVGVGSANAKKPTLTFNKATKELLKTMKAEIS